MTDSSGQATVAVRATLAVFVLSAAVLALHAWSYYPYVVDDAFISMRYAERLIGGQGLT